MDLCSPRQIADLLSKHGFSFRKTLGQNFLTARGVIDKIIDSSPLSKDVGVLEIGPGIGVLTTELAQRAGKVVSVELDRRLAPILDETLAGHDNVHIHYQDALKVDYSALVKTHFEGLTPIVVANLPYQITTPILAKLLETKLFSSLTVMMQKEVGARLVASAGTGDYGAFSVFIAYYGQGEILFDVSPGSFMPAPKVTSSVVQITPHPAPPVTTPGDDLFFVVKAAFAKRRKTLLNCLSAALPHVEKMVIEGILRDGEIDPGIRGERLDLQDFARIADRLKSLLDNSN